MGYESNLTQIGPETWHFGGSQFRLCTEIKNCKVGDLKLQALQSIYVLFEAVAEQVFVKHGHMM